MNQLEIIQDKIKDHKKEIELIKSFKSKSYKIRVKQLKLMIKRSNNTIQYNIRNKIK